MQELFWHSTFPHFTLNYPDLISLVNNITYFAFKGSSRKYVDFSGNTAFECHKPAHLNFFTKNYLQRKVEQLIKCYHFEVRNLIVLQTISTPMNIDPAPFSFYFYLSQQECDAMSKFIKKTLREENFFVKFSDLLMTFVLLMIERNFKIYIKKFTLRNWS